MQRPGVKRLTLWHGPFQLLVPDEVLLAFSDENTRLIAFQAAKINNAPRSVNNSNPFLTNVLGFPENSYILRTDSTLRYKDGTIPGPNEVHNHHVMMFDVRGPGKNRDPIFKCGKLGEIEKAAHGLQIPRGYIGMRRLSHTDVSSSNVGGSTMDRSPALFSSEDGKYNSGHQLGAAKESKVAFFSELINETPKTLEVYSVTEVDYIPGNPPGMMDSSVGIVSVNECDGGIPDTSLEIPKGKMKFSFQSKPITITESGYMVCKLSSQ
jgi:hypothetical protein